MKTKQGLQRTRPMRVVVNGVTYSCVRRNGKITVRTSRTAKGQNLVVGVYDLVTETWQNDNGDNSLSETAKVQIIRAISK